MEKKRILEVSREIEFSYPDDREVSYVIPPGLWLHLGEVWCLRGVSGSGKSTLMTLLAGLRRFAGGGRISFHFPPGKVEITGDGWSERAGPALWRHIGFAFQRPELIRALDVRRNLGLVLEGRDLIAPALFDRQEWRRVARSKVWEISGGQIQRLGLLRAFGLGQKLVFLDEPTNNLDRRNRAAVAGFVRQQRQGRALVVVSHDEDFIRTLEVDRVLKVHEAQWPGRVRRTLSVERATS